MPAVLHWGATGLSTPDIGDSYDDLFKVAQGRIRRSQSKEGSSHGHTILCYEFRLLV
jgi:hypothetical protein